MRALVTGLLVSALLAAPGNARAAEPAASGAAPEPAFADRFFRGTSPGELPAPKVLVVTTLYAASLASLIVGVTALVRAEGKADDALAFKLEQAAGFCNDLVSEPCRQYRSLFASEQETRATGLLLLGAGGLAALGGALTAELWQNDPSAPRLSLAVDGRGAALTAGGSF
jgi:hypothetical protein